MELVKCVRADPEAITKHALHQHVFAALQNEGEAVSLKILVNNKISTSLQLQCSLPKCSPCTSYWHA